MHASGLSQNVAVTTQNNQATQQQSLGGVANTSEPRQGEPLGEPLATLTHPSNATQAILESGVTTQNNPNKTPGETLRGLHGELNKTCKEVTLGEPAGDSGDDVEEDGKDHHEKNVETSGGAPVKQRGSTVEENVCNVACVHGTSWEGLLASHQQAENARQIAEQHAGSDSETTTSEDETVNKIMQGFVVCIKNMLEREKEARDNAERTGGENTRLYETISKLQMENAKLRTKLTLAGRQRPTKEEGNVFGTRLGNSAP